MHQTFSGYSHHDHFDIAGDSKRPLSNYSNLNLHSDKPHPSKALRWNIEESKENVSFQKKYDYSNPYLQSRTYEPKEAQAAYLGAKKEAKEEMADYSKTWTAKSYKSIKFSNELEQQYEMSKSYGNLNKDAKTNPPKTQELKELTKSLGYSSSVKDLISNLRGEEPKVERNPKKMKTCKSQKRVFADLDKPYDTSYEANPKSQYSGIKSHKKLADVLTNESYLKPKPGAQGTATTLTRSDKSAKDLSKYSNYKTCDKLDITSDFDKLKRPATYNYSQTQKPKDPSSKHTLSLSDFQLGSCKGEGAFGQVFPAIHKASKMLVAIKKVSKQKVKYMLEQFINQIKIQMFLDHPNIVKLYGFFDDLTHFYIVMEYMEGGSLFCYIKKQKKLTPQETAARLKEVCLGLKEMHDHSILHRDIKPENIVMTNDVCKLCDFGWSAVCKDRRTTYCGTLDYISPEIVGGKGYDDSVDIWCIGVLAYEMICGKTPFYNISRTQTMKKIMNVKYEYPAELTGRARSFIDKILKKNPEDRLDIDEVLRDSFLA